ncbi:MAG: hypothetical protein NC110_07175 [Ruminococcus sp.]|nr:hypothetical protein [Ruminococcus sp.]
MSERYTKLFTLPENLYAEGAPVVVSAGALLKDNQTGKVLAQIKIKNISSSAIKAAKIRIAPFDTVGNPIDEAIEHEYLDLNVQRDGEFGQKTPIALSNASTRAFDVTVSEVIFSDNSIWNDGGNEWKSLSKQVNLENVLNNDRELLKQYRIEYGSNCKYEVADDMDLWHCSCGAVNRNSEANCHRCNCSYEDLKNVNLESLEEKKSIRLAEEKLKAQEAEAAAKAKAKKIKKICAIVIPIVVVLIVAGSLISNYVSKSNVYKEALALVEPIKFGESVEFSKWTTADLDKWLDSYDKQIESIYSEEELDNIYDIDDILKPFDQAIENLEALGGFKDSAEQVKETKYQKAIIYFAGAYFDSYLDIANTLGDYKDCADMSVFANFVKGVSKSFMNTSDTEIKKLAEKNAMAKDLYNTYNKYKPYCGTFKCVTKGKLKGDIIISDFYYNYNSGVCWKCTDKDGSNSIIKYAPYYNKDKNMYKESYEVLDFDRNVKNMTIKDSYNDYYYSSYSYKRYNNYTIDCSVSFKNNQIIYSSKHSAYNKTLTLKYSKTK